QWRRRFLVCWMSQPPLRDSRRSVSSTRWCRGSHTVLTLERDALDFQLPEKLEAHEPPEARGLARDPVRLLVSHLSDNRVEHRRFTDLPHVLRPGDLVIANDSATLPAALRAYRQDGTEIALNISTRLPADLGA